MDEGLFNDNFDQCDNQSAQQQGIQHEQDHLHLLVPIVETITTNSPSPRKRPAKKLSKERIAKQVTKIIQI